MGGHHSFSSTLCIGDLCSVANFSNFSSIFLSCLLWLEEDDLLGIFGHLCSLIRRSILEMLLIACFHLHLGSFMMASQDVLILSLLIIELCRSIKYNSKHPTALGFPLSDLYSTGSFVLNKMSSDGIYTICMVVFWIYQLLQMTIILVTPFWCKILTLYHYDVFGFTIKVCINWQ